MKLSISRNKREGYYSVRKGFAYIIIELPNGMWVGETVAVFRTLGVLRA